MCIYKITDTYHILGTYMNRACSFHANERECSSEVRLLLQANRCLVKIYHALFLLQRPVMLCTKRGVFYGYKRAFLANRFVSFLFE